MGAIFGSTQTSHHFSEIVDAYERSGSRVDRTDITRDALAVKHTNARTPLHVSHLRAA
jgi:hypothetical protein